MKMINASNGKYAIEKLNDPYDEASVELFVALMTDKHYKYSHWRPHFEEAQKCYRYFNGDIFDEEKRANLRAQNKFPVERAEYKPFINSLRSSLIKAKPNGRVEVAGFNESPKAASAGDMDLVLQKIKKDLRYDYNVSEVCRDGLIAGYPVCILFDLEKKQYGGNGKLALKRMPFDSVLPGRSWNGDMSEVNDAIFTTLLTYEEIKEQFPDKAKVIDKYIEDHYFNDVVITPPDNFLGVDNTIWAEVIAQMTQDWATFQNSNSWTIYRWIRPITAKIVRYINYSNGDVVILPNVWEEEQVMQWIADHPEYEEIEEYAPVLWETTATQTGIILENRPSWYQNNGELPAAFFVPDMVNRTPRGIMNDLLPFVYAGAITATEGLAQVIRGNRRTNFIVEGSVEDEESARDELIKEEGWITIKQGKEPPTIAQSTPNMSYLDYDNMNYGKAQQAIRVSEQMMGNISQYQSKVGIEKALSQGLEAQGTYLNNLTSFDLKLNRIILNAIPVFMTEQELISIEDDFGNEHNILVNETQEIEEMTMPQTMTEEEPRTIAHIIANDLSSGKYFYNIVAGDYSSMTREESMNKFMAFFNQGGANIAINNPQLFITICKNTTDRYFNTIGKQAEEAMQQQQQQQAEQAEKEKQEILSENMQERIFELVKELAKRATPQTLMNVTPETIAEAPDGYKAGLEYQQEATAHAANMALSIIAPQEKEDMGLLQQLSEGE